MENGLIEIRHAQQCAHGSTGIVRRATWFLPYTIIYPKSEWFFEISTSVILVNVMPGYSQDYCGKTLAKDRPTQKLILSKKTV